MTGREYLRKAHRMKQSLDHKMEQLKQLRASSEGTTVSYSDAPRGGFNPERMAMAIENVIDQWQKLAEAVLPLIEMQRRIQKCINKIQDLNNRTILELYYLNGYSWKKVAREMNYSEATVFQRHKEALIEFESLFILES